jgi:hypothetical protein
MHRSSSTRFGGSNSTRTTRPVRTQTTSIAQTQPQQLKLNLNQKQVLFRRRICPSVAMRPYNRDQIILLNYASHSNLFRTPYRARNSVARVKRTKCARKIETLMSIDPANSIRNMRVCYRDHTWMIFVGLYCQRVLRRTVLVGVTGASLLVTRRLNS